MPVTRDQLATHTAIMEAVETQNAVDRYDMDMLAAFGLGGICLIAGGFSFLASRLKKEHALKIESLLQENTQENE